MEFLETLETIRAEEASVKKLFNSDDGTGVRHMKKSPQYLESLSEAAKFIGQVLEGRRPMYHLREALTTSDFPYLFGDILDRQLLAEYKATTPVYRNFVRIATVPDFRTVKRFTISGADQVLSEVKEQGEYPETSLSDDENTYTVSKYGRRIPFSWEAIINDDLDALKDIPRRFARAASRTEQKFVTNMYCDSAGPNDSWFDSDLTGTAALDIAALEAALSTWATYSVDANDEPVSIEGAHLVVPPTLEITAKKILNTIEIQDTTATNHNIKYNNFLKNQLKLSVDPYIPIIATTNGNTSWFLFADPGNGRPAAEVGFLRGHTSPEIFIKSPNASRAGGGTVNAMDGDFDTDSIQYKVRHVIGGTMLDNKMAYGSDGSA